MNLQAHRNQEDNDGSERAEGLVQQVPPRQLTVGHQDRNEGEEYPGPARDEPAVRKQQQEWNQREDGDSGEELRLRRRRRPKRREHQGKDGKEQRRDVGSAIPRSPPDQ